jgi:hypothetical protein
VNISAAVRPGGLSASAAAFHAMSFMTLPQI